MEALETIVKEGSKEIPFDSLTPEDGIPLLVSIEGVNYEIKYDRKNQGPISFGPPEDIGKTITFYGLSPEIESDAAMIRAMAMHAQMRYTSAPAMTEAEFLLENYGIVKKPRQPRVKVAQKEAIAA